MSAVSCAPKSQEGAPHHHSEALENFAVPEEGGNRAQKPQRFCTSAVLTPKPRACVASRPSRQGTKRATMTGTRKLCGLHQSRLSREKKLQTPRSTPPRGPQESLSVLDQLSWVLLTVPDRSLSAKFRALDSQLLIPSQEILILIRAELNGLTV